MIKPARRQIIQTVILCAVMLLMAFPVHAGFVLGFWLLFLIPLTIKSLFTILVKKEEKKQKIIQIALWSISCSIIAFHHIYLHKTSKKYANFVSNAVESFYLKNGVYPKSLVDAGINPESAKKFRVHFLNSNSQPLLMYPATWIVFSTYYYDFKIKKWLFRSS